MKFLPKELKRSFDLALKQCSNDKDILSKPLMCAEDVLKAHYILADYFTDVTANENTERMLVGVRSFDLLESAIHRQICSFGGHRKYTNNLDICSTLFFGLVKDHAFFDGNKRTALLTLLNQLQAFNYYPTANITDFENLVIAVADNSLSKKYAYVWKKFKKDSDPEVKTISYLLRRMVTPKCTSFHVDITMREFIYVLEKQGVECENTGTKIKMTRISKKLIFPIKYSYTIKFYGLTRVIEPGVARDTFTALHLFDDYPSFDSLFSYNEPMYKLINQFEEPLRRLKDE